MFEQEEWRPVVGFVGLYEVSSLGRVRSVTRVITMTSGRCAAPHEYLRRGRVLKAYANKARGGYRYVNLHDEAGQHMRRVCRLVAEAFFGPCPAGFQVCHNNGAAADDRAVNLRFDTARNNSADKRAHGTHLFGERVASARLTARQVRRVKAGAESSAQLAAEMGVHPGHINNIRRGVRWAHVG